MYESDVTKDLFETWGYWCSAGGNQGVVSFSGAWGLWWTGAEDIKAYLLGPCSILWWGRIGKVIQGLVAFGVLIEVVGNRRLGKAGEWARNLGYMPRKFVREQLAAFPSETMWNVSFVIGWLTGASLIVYCGYYLLMTNIVGFVALAVGGTWLSLLAAWATKDIGIFLVTIPRILGLPIVLPVLVVAFTVLLILYSIATLIVAPVLLSLAWILRQKSLANWVRVTGLLVLCVGFSLDLLAS